MRYVDDDLVDTRRHQRIEVVVDQAALTHFDQGLGKGIRQWREAFTTPRGKYHGRFRPHRHDLPTRRR